VTPHRCLSIQEQPLSWREESLRLPASGTYLLAERIESVSIEFQQAKRDLASAAQPRSINENASKSQ